MSRPSLHLEQPLSQPPSSPSAHPLIPPNLEAADPAIRTQIRGGTRNERHQSERKKCGRKYVVPELGTHSLTLESFIASSKACMTWLRQAPSPSILLLLLLRLSDRVWLEVRAIHSRCGGSPISLSHSAPPPLIVNVFSCNLSLIVCSSIAFTEKTSRWWAICDGETNKINN